MASLLTLLNEILTYLAANGVGTVGSNLFAAHLPAKPTKSTSVQLTGGPKGEGDPLQRPRIQVLIRDSSYPAGFAKACSVYELLNHKVPGLATVKGRVVPDHEPGPMYLDANDQIVFTLNFHWVVAP